jgi:hypothetical protein
MRIQCSEPEDRRRDFEAEFEFAPWRRKKEFDLESFHTLEQLLAADMDQLKSALQLRGMKGGGTHEERAGRLFLARALPFGELRQKLEPKHFPKQKADLATEGEVFENMQAGSKDGYTKKPDKQQFEKKVAEVQNSIDTLSIQMQNEKAGAAKEKGICGKIKKEKDKTKKKLDEEHNTIREMLKDWREINNKEQKLDEEYSEDLKRAEKKEDRVSLERANRQKRKQINKKIAAQGQVVVTMKADKAEEAAIKEAAALLLKLKAEHKALIKAIKALTGEAEKADAEKQMKRFIPKCKALSQNLLADVKKVEKPPTLEIKEPEEEEDLDWDDDDADFEIGNGKVDLRAQREVELAKEQECRNAEWDEHRGHPLCDSYSADLTTKEVVEIGASNDDFLRGLWGFSTKDDNETASSAPSIASKATSAFTVIETNHGRQRMDQRQISIKQLQTAVKHGVKTALEPEDGEPQGRIRYEFEGIIYITDHQSRRCITCWNKKLAVLPSRAVHKQQIQWRKLQNAFQIEDLTKQIATEWSANTVANWVFRVSLKRAEKKEDRVSLELGERAKKQKRKQINKKITAQGQVVVTMKADWGAEEAAIKEAAALLLKLKAERKALIKAIKAGEAEKADAEKQRKRCIPKYKALAQNFFAKEIDGKIFFDPRFTSEHLAKGIFQSTGAMKEERAEEEEEEAANNDESIMCSTIMAERSKELTRCSTIMAERSKELTRRRYQQLHPLVSAHLLATTSPPSIADTYSSWGEKVTRYIVSKCTDQEAEHILKDVHIHALFQEIDAADAELKRKLHDSRCGSTQEGAKKQQQQQQQQQQKKKKKKQQRNFPCLQCEQRFGTKQHLKSHRFGCVCTVQFGKTN